MTDINSYQGIIFEGKFQESLMYFAVLEGFANPIERDDITKSILSDYRKANKRTQALDLCLIYDKVHLYSYADAFNISGLTNEGLVQVLEPTDFAETRSEEENTSPFLSTDDLPNLFFLKPIILPYLRRTYKFIDNSNYEKIISILTTKEFVILIRDLGESLESPNKYVAVPLAIRKDLLEVRLRGMSRDAFYTFLNQKPTDERKKLVDDIQGELGLIVFYMFWIYEDLFMILDLLKKSATLSVPLATSTLAKPRNINSSLQNIESLASVERYYRVFEIIVNEVEYFPRVDSLKDVLKLRNDKRIIDFRNNLQNWASALRDGDTNLEEELRREISKSNQALRKLDKWKKAGSFITYAALPISILPILGLPLSIISTAMQLYIDSTEWKHKWLLVGR